MTKQHMAAPILSANGVKHGVKVHLKKTNLALIDETKSGMVGLGCRLEQQLLKFTRICVDVFFVYGHAVLFVHPEILWS